MFKTTDALVLREVRYKEADRILTLLTSTDGKITAKAPGALRKSSRIAASTQQLTFSEMTLFENRGKWSVKEAVIKEAFSGLRDDIEDFALGSYFAECLESLAVEDQSDAALLQLGLNSLYALSRKLYQPEHVKSAFEFRLMCLAGYEPELDHCAVCGNTEPPEPVLLLKRGSVGCRNCVRTSEEYALLDTDSLAALRYVVNAEAKKIFSFSVGDSSLVRLSSASEQYLLTHMERRFSTLDYWKNIRIRTI